MIGRFRYLQKAVLMAFRSGRFGPDIFEHQQFNNYHIPAAIKPIPWEQSDLTATPDLSQGLHKKLRTTSFLVIEDNSIIAEAYAHGGAMDRPSNSFSMAKSIVATVAGMCLWQGLMRSEEPIRNLLPDLHPDLGTIRIEDLLSMSTGLQWDESPSFNSDNALAYYGTDLPKMLVQLRMKEGPAINFEYVSVASQLLAACIRSSTGRSVQEWVVKDLWPALGCEHEAFWNLDRPQGVVKAFCCFYTTARDFARLGRLYLNGGSYAGEQLIGQDFIEIATHANNSFDPYTGRQNDCYGWHWWTVTHKECYYFYARGIRGQYIICCPSTNRIAVRLGHHRLAVSPSTGHPPDLYTWIEAMQEI